MSDFPNEKRIMAPQHARDFFAALPPEAQPSECFAAIISARAHAGDALRGIGAEFARLAADASAVIVPAPPRRAIREHFNDHKRHNEDCSLPNHINSLVDSFWNPNADHDWEVDRPVIEKEMGKELGAVACAMGVIDDEGLHTGFDDAADLAAFDLMLYFLACKANLHSEAWDAVFCDHGDELWPSETKVACPFDKYFHGFGRIKAPEKVWENIGESGFGTALELLVVPPSIVHLKDERLVDVAKMRAALRRGDHWR
jgi:hypothetical protein